GQLLRQSPYTGNFSYADVKKLAAGAGNDQDGYRQEFIKLVDIAAALTPTKPDNKTSGVVSLSE
ncbi:MAG: DUF3520 domain-containing protein, partial [Azonexus sp.]|nr:DUF3520 domain-containing protein [Azonexus sp.]